MKILIVNTNDTGGAAKACIRLHLGLLARKVDSNLLLKQKSDYSIPKSFFFPQPPKVLTVEQIIYNKALTLLKKYSVLAESEYETEQKSQRAFLQKRPEGLETFSFPFTTTDITLNPLYQEADIIHLHWVAGFLDYPSFFAKNTKPIIWTLHDASPFLGGEHYAERFLGIDNTGKPIPRMYTDAEKQASNKYLKVKQSALENVKPFPVVAPSLWLKNESEKSVLLNRFPHQLISYGFPTHIFKPLKRQFCRDVLGIPQDKKVLLFVASDVTIQRKGYAYLKRVFSNMSNEPSKNYFLCAIGRESDLGMTENLLELGGIKDERLMAMAYSAADVFVLPSLEDNLPNTMIESLLCGTPVIGFPVGGIYDTIENGVNGFLCDEISVDSLKNTIEKYFDEIHLFNNLKVAQNAAIEFNLSKQAERYIELYKALLM